MVWPGTGLVAQGCRETGRADNAGARQVGRERGTVVELRIAIEVLSDEDVERRAADSVEEPAELDAPGQRRAHAESCQHVAGIGWGAARVVRAKIILIGREPARTVGLVETQVIEAVEERLLLVAKEEVRSETVGGGDSLRTVLVYVLVATERARAAGWDAGVIRSRKRRVDVEQHLVVDAAVRRVGLGDRADAADLALQTDAGADVIRGVETGADLVNGRCRLAAQGGGWIVRCTDDELLLRDASSGVRSGAHWKT